MLEQTKEWLHTGPRAAAGLPGERGKGKASEETGTKQPSYKGDTPRGTQTSLKHKNSYEMGKLAGASESSCKSFSNISNFWVDSSQEYFSPFMCYSGAII